MKFLLFLILAGGAGALYFKDRNDEAQVSTLQAQVDDLTNQVQQKQQALNQAQAQLQSLRNEASNAPGVSNVPGAPNGPRAPGGFGGSDNVLGNPTLDLSQPQGQQHEQPHH